MSDVNNNAPRLRPNASRVTRRVDPVKPTTAAPQADASKTAKRLGTQHFEVRVSPEAFVRRLPLSVYTNEEPIGTDSAIPFWFLFEGYNLVLENWYYARSPLARRCAVEVKWASEDVNFSLIGLGFGSRKAQQ